VDLHDPIEGNRQERGGDHVGEQGRIAEHPAVANAHPTDCEARHRADHQGEEHRADADIEAVGELVPELLEVPVALGDDDPEALERRPGWKDRFGEHVALRFERHHEYVVDRNQGPDQHQDGDADRAHLLPPAQPARAPCALRRQGHDGQAYGNGDRVLDGNCHSVTSVVRSLRIRISTSGIMSGNAVSTAATPSSGRATSKALRMPSVASTWVERAGPPPETKNTELKSPRVKMVESSVHTR